MPELNTQLRRNKFEIAVYLKGSPLGVRELKGYLRKIYDNLPELKDIYLSVSIIGDEEMRKLNFKFTGRNHPTDVLSFLYEDMEPKLGEIIISAEQAIKNAGRFGNTAKEELLTYLIHGILHLLGYDDFGEEERRKMFGKQRQILRQILE